MTKQLTRNVIDQIAALEAQIAAANPQQLLVLQPRLHVLLQGLDRKGYAVPAHLRKMYEDLESDAVEAQFDNMPL